MTRRATAVLAMVLVTGLVLADLIATRPNPYRAPPILAVGSGAASAGGFCGALPD